MEVFPVAVALIFRALFVSARWTARLRWLALRQAAANAASSRLAELDARVVMLEDALEPRDAHIAVLEGWLGGKRTRRPYPPAERLRILWLMEYFQIPQRRLRRTLGVSRASVHRWIKALQDGRLDKRQQPAEGPDQGLLHDILGRVVIVYDFSREVGHSHSVPRHQSVEGIQVAVSHSRYQLSIGAGRPFHPRILLPVQSTPEAEMFALAHSHASPRGCWPPLPGSAVMGGNRCASLPVVFRQTRDIGNDSHSSTLQKGKRRLRRRRIVQYDRTAWDWRQAHRALRGVLSPFDIHTLSRGRTRGSDRPFRRTRRNPADRTGGEGSVRHAIHATANREDP